MATGVPQDHPGGVEVGGGAQEGGGACEALEKKELEVWRYRKPTRWWSGGEAENNRNEASGEISKYKITYWCYILVVRKNNTGRRVSKSKPMQRRKHTTSPHRLHSPAGWGSPSAYRPGGAACRRHSVMATPASRWHHGPGNESVQTKETRKIGVAILFLLKSGTS